MTNICPTLSRRLIPLNADPSSLSPAPRSRWTPPSRRSSDGTSEGLFPDDPAQPAKKTAIIKTISEAVGRRKPRTPNATCLAAPNRLTPYL